MAARLPQLRSKAVQASEFASKHGCAYYKEFMEKNKHHIVQPPTVEKCSCQSSCFTLVLQGLPLHALCLLGWSVRPELCDGIPGRYESFWKELDGAKHIWRSRNELKVEDAGIAALFGLELYAWFCVGEIVGRGFTFTGYWV